MSIVPADLLGETLILDLQELLKLAVAQIRAKGHEGAEATLEIGDKGAAMLRLRVRNGTRPFVSRYGLSNFDWEFIEARSFGAALTQARGVIAAMEEHPTRAMAPWFELDQSDAPSSSAASAGGDGHRLGGSASPPVAATSPASPARDPARDGDGLDPVPTAEAVVVDFPRARGDR